MKLSSCLVPAAATLLLLTGCEGETKKANDQRTAVGEILPASVSDEMIRYETLRSQPPLAPEAEKAGVPGTKRGGTAATKTGATAGAGDDAADDVAPAAAAPTPEPAQPAAE